MDIDRRIELISRPPTEEILVPEELRAILETEEHPIAYGGWEPSGMVHLGTGLMCAYKMKDLIEAGIRFKAYLATWHSWINRKLGGNIELIKKAAEHFKHSWISLGVPENKVEWVIPDEEYGIEYWNKVVNIAKVMTIARTTRTLEIAGRSETEARYVADYMYTPMQIADIFHFGVKICQLGMDQRKANVVAREIGDKLGFWKPVCVHHHLLQGLAKPPVWPIPQEKEKDILASIKMSKSKPDTCIWIYDSPDEIKRKIDNAFCPEKIVENNPIMDICRWIIFRESDNFVVERPAKYGGRLEFESYEKLRDTYRSGNLHPKDLKDSVAVKLADILEPSRRYFSKNKDAAKTLDMLRKAIITR